MQVCGLKQKWKEITQSVDVTPHVGVWIETEILAWSESLTQGHTSCRCVD